MTLDQYLEEQPRGTKKRLAAALGVSPSYFSRMLGGQKPISPQHAKIIERESGGRVSRHELLPEIYEEERKTVA